MNNNTHTPTALIALAVCGVALAAPIASPLAAQVTEVSRAPVADMAQITFGYRCDDRFVIRNDGNRAVDLEYSVEKSNEHSKLTLGARELVELNSPSKGDMELWMDGKLIAKAEKDKRSCKDVQGTASVAVAPLEVVTNDDARRDNYTRIGPYPYNDPFFFSSGFGYYGGLGYSPFYRGYLGSTIIITSGRGGGVRGGGRRGR